MRRHGRDRYDCLGDVCCRSERGLRLEIDTAQPTEPRAGCTGGETTSIATTPGDTTCHTPTIDTTRTIGIECHALIDVHSTFIIDTLHGHCIRLRKPVHDVHCFDVRHDTSLHRTHNHRYSTQEIYREVSMHPSLFIDTHNVRDSSCYTLA